MLIRVVSFLSIFLTKDTKLNNTISEGAVVLSRRERLKEHWQRNKKVYIGVGIGVAGLAVGFGVGFKLAKYINAKKLAEVAASSAVLVSNTTAINGSNNVVKNVTKIANHVDHLSYISKIIWPDGTEKILDTQAEVARFLGVSEADLSKHINHGRSLPGGVQVIRMGVRIANHFA